MQLPSNFDEHGAQFAWDSTTLKAAYTCQRYYYYAFVENFSTENNSVHLLFGGIYAASLEHYHKMLATEDCTHEEAVFSAVRYAMIRSWIHNLTPEGERRPGTGHPAEFLSSSKTRRNLIRTIIWYLEEFRNSDYTTLKLSDGRPAVEYSFKLPVDNGFVFCGHLDRVVDMVGDNFIQDQKSTGTSLSAWSFLQYDLDVQMSMYTFAGNAIFHTPVKGVMVDIAQIATDYSKFLRGFTYRTKEQLEEFYAESMAKIIETRERTKRWRDTEDESAFPRNLTACGNYGGCPFRETCRQPAKYRQKFIRSNLARRAEPWNPLVAR